MINIISKKINFEEISIFDIHKMWVSRQWASYSKKRKKKKKNKQH